MDDLGAHGGDVAGVLPMFELVRDKPGIDSAHGNCNSQSAIHDGVSLQNKQGMQMRREKGETW
jgi:hypothetical protein